MSAFRDLSPDQQLRLEEAAAWRLRLARDPDLKHSAEYVTWSADPDNRSALNAVQEAWSALGPIDTTPEKPTPR